MNKIRFLDGTTIKLLAIITMLIDHVGAIFFPEQMWFRAIGRIAMPIFAFCVAEGFSYTHDKKKYLLRLGIFAILTEVPFDLAFWGEVGFRHQNIMVTFFLAVLALMFYEKICGEPDPVTGAYPFSRKMLAWLPILLAAVLAEVLKTDYSSLGVIVVVLFYVTRKLPHWLRTLVGMGYILLMRNVGVYLYTGLSGIPILMYNGKRGPGLKWLFYGFYPGHLLILYLIKLLL